MSANTNVAAGPFDMFEPDLEARDVLFDLLDEGQMPRQFGQSQIRLDPRRLDGRRAGGDQRGIESSFLARRRCTQA